MAKRDLKSIVSDLELATESVGELLYLLGERDPTVPGDREEPGPGGYLGVLLLYKLRELVSELQS